MVKNFKKFVSVLTITALTVFTIGWTFTPKPEIEIIGDGNWMYLCTGFFITNDGYIATAGHCVNGNRTLSVDFKGQTYKATLVEADLPDDVAIYKINVSNTPALAVATGASTRERIHILGYPDPMTFGYNLKIHSGYIIGADRVGYDMFARTCEGNSGGPVVNSKNQVVGILTEGYGSRVCSNMTYMVSIEYIENIAARHNIQLQFDLTASEKSPKDIYNKDIDSVVLIYKSL